MLWKWAVRRKIAYQDLNIRQQFFFCFENTEGKFSRNDGMQI